MAKAKRGDGFPGGRSLPTWFQCIFLATMKGDSVGEEGISTANMFPKEKPHCPKHSPVPSLRTLISSCWPVRIPSISLGDQKRSLFMSLMLAALLERARPESQDTRVSSDAPSPCDLLQVFFLCSSLLSLIHIIIPM